MGSPTRPTLPATSDGSSARPPRGSGGNGLARRSFSDSVGTYKKSSGMCKTAASPPRVTVVPEASPTHQRAVSGSGRTRGGMAMASRVYDEQPPYASSFCRIRRLCRSSLRSERGVGDDGEGYEGTYRPPVCFSIKPLACMTTAFYQTPRNSSLD